MRSLPNCKIDFVAAERMYQATVKLLDEIERLQAYITRIEAAYMQLYRESISVSGNVEGKEAIRGRMARESLERIKVIELSREIEDQAAELRDAAEKNDIDRIGECADTISELCERILQIVEGEDA